MFARMLFAGGESAFTVRQRQYVDKEAEKSAENRAVVLNSSSVAEESPNVF